VKSQAERFAASLAKNVDPSLRLDKVLFPAVTLAACFAGGLIDCDAYFPQHIAYCHLRIIER
jgi:hypothetical protein